MEQEDSQDHYKAYQKGTKDLPILLTILSIFIPGALMRAFFRELFVAHKDDPLRIFLAVGLVVLVLALIATLIIIIVRRDKRVLLSLGRDAIQCFDVECKKSRNYLWSEIRLIQSIDSFSIKIIPRSLEQGRVVLFGFYSERRKEQFLEEAKEILGINGNNG